VQTEVCDLSVTVLADLLARREVSPVELVSALLDRIDRYDGALHSYISVCRETAPAAARRAEQEIRSGLRRGPLHGIPIAHKDIYFTRGVRTTAHSRTMPEFVPEYDATVVERLDAAGMILVGKTNTTEFAIGTMDVFGTARNPWNASCYTGGSSGGSGAAIAAGLAVAATGSDTGGSIRIPASFCGVAGIKPTYGRVSRHGVVPLSWSMDHVGPMCRTVADCALLLGAMAGRDPRDPTSSPRPVPDYLAALGRDIRDTILGVPAQHFYERLDAEIEEAVRAALRHLEGLGVRLEPVQLPHAGEIGPVGWAVMAPEAYGHHATRLRRRFADYGSRARRRIAAGAFITAGEYQQALRLRTLWTREVNSALERVHAIVTPTMPFAAFSIETQESEPPDTTWGTIPFNLSGHPALTVPCGFTAAGLPIGMQLVGRPFDESTLFRIGHAYEQSTGWHRRRPVLEGLA
jgi:aspartyl-tRNA(Asn)/glutamyl-tRNA(Gln) amidotransferase subunit A